MLPSPTPTTRVVGACLQSRLQAGRFLLPYPNPSPDLKNESGEGNFKQDGIFSISFVYLRSFVVNPDLHFSLNLKSLPLDKIELARRGYPHPAAP
jgi:hypothetical protein